MSQQGLDAATAAMRKAGVREAAIRAFAHAYHELDAGATGLIPEGSIDPVDDIPALTGMQVSKQDAAQALDRTAVIRLNGGLGTSMGMDRAKSLLPVRGARTFLEVVVAQVLHLRRTTGARLPFFVMNSFRTQADSLRYLESVTGLALPGLPLDFLQNAEPKLRTDDLTPVAWPTDPALEWCPPGHGDIFTTLYEESLLRTLLDQGYRHLLIANGDNLGAYPDGRIAGWFAESGAPYLAEVTRRTPADRKGGHLARRRSDGCLLLRDTAQTLPEDLDHFMDESRHPFAHCNTLWFDIAALQARLEQEQGVLGLALIRNEKNVDPTDPDSPRVYQLETAMGSAVSAFEGAIALEVGRDRFLPVKTTDDLLLLRSDVYEMGEDAVPRLRTERAPLVRLDERYYRRISDFEARFPSGPPSLVRASSLTVRGDWTFGEGVRVAGHAVLEPDPAGAGHVPNASVLA